MISIIPIKGIPIIKTEEELWQVISDKFTQLVDGDIIVCAHTPFSRVMGKLYTIEDIIPGEEAINIGEEIGKDAKKVEIVLGASKEVVKIGRRVIISRNHADVVCANAGVDESNAGIGKALAVPDDPDALAKELREYIMDKLNRNVAVIISDTVGRALRKGAVNIAIGCAGIPSMKSEVGRKDLFGYEMRVSEIAIADEIASAAELLQGQTDEGVPFVIVRGYSIDFTGKEDARSINRPEDERLFK